MSDSPVLNWSRHQWASDKVTNVVVFRGPYIFCVQSTRPLQKTRSSGTIFQNYYYAWQVGLVIRSRLICLHFENNLNTVNSKESEIDLSLISKLKVFIINFLGINASTFWNATSGENRVFNFSGGIPLDLYRIKFRQYTSTNCQTKFRKLIFSLSLSHARDPPPQKKIRCNNCFKLWKLSHNVNYISNIL